jgi:hypothetical protein
VLHDPHDLLGLQRPPASREHAVQTLAVHEGHLDVEMTADLPEVVDGEDVLVAELRREAGLTLEPGPELPVLGQLGPQTFEGDRSPLRGVFGLPDLAHSAFTQQLDEPEASELLWQCNPHPLVG